MKLGLCCGAFGLLLGLTTPASAAADPPPVQRDGAPAGQVGDAAVPIPTSAAAELSPIAPDALAPFKVVRSLQALQDMVAHGNTNAQAALGKLLSHIADVFTAADPAVWKDRRNDEAAVLYLFSAGKPSVVRALLDRAAFAPESDRLLKGALAYAEGQDGAARAILGTIDPKSLPQGVGGHLALVLATLLAHDEPQKASRMLDIARLLVPGTLVEEAALRRQIFLLADPASLDKFASLSRQYLRRFRGSVFAANFKQRFTSFAATIAATGDVAQLAKFEPVLSDLGSAERRGIYLDLARASLIQGKLATGRYAADKAVPLCEGDPVDAARAKLYAAAAAAPSNDAGAGQSVLTAVDPNLLPPKDAELRDAAMTVAQAVDADLKTRPIEPAAQGTDPTPTTSADALAAALFERGHHAIAATDSLLGTSR